ncbi:2'-5' RNA ligase family protein [soil metagenome]
MAPQKNRYFIALVLPSPFNEQAIELKNYFKDRYRSKASLNSPPHITLHMPFEWRGDRENDLIESLKNFSKSLTSAEVKLENFGCFEPRVIFINVFHSQELNDLQYQLRQFCKKELGLFNADYKDFPFRPHITLAFRDLKKLEFAKAWEEFRDKKLNGKFLVNRLCLLKHKDGIWGAFKELEVG